MAKRTETATPGLNRLLRDLRKLPKTAQGELRDASVDIATRHMVPAWQRAARNAGPWGADIAGSVRARRDRIPAVVIGSNRRTLSGGASPTMVRYPSAFGRVRPEIPAAFTRTEWMSSVQPGYIAGALSEWGAAVSKVCRDFNNGPDY